MNGPEDRLRAVVLSGGGANGAYEVGVLKALLAGKSPSTRGAPLVPDIFTGTSIGSFNATFLVSHWDAAGSTVTGDLETVWLDRLAEGRCGNGAYRFRFDPVELLSPACYVPNPFRPVAQLARDSALVAWEGLQRTVNLVVAKRDEGFRQRLADLPNFTTFVSNEPWFDSIRQSINFEAVRTSSRRLRIAATNWNTGELRIFRNLDMTDRLGPLAVMASSAIPGVFPEVMIGAEPHVDGGVLMNTPLKLATDSGASEVHVIYLDPDVRSIPVSALQSTIGTLYRQQVISWAQVVNDDIDDAAMINRGLEILGRVGEGAEVADPELAQLAKSLHGIWRRLRKFVRYRPLTVHRYHPRDDLSSGALGMLNLDRRHLDELIQRGFMDAVTHDCDESGCVIPNREEKAEIRETVAATTGELPAVPAAPAEPAAAMIPVPPPEEGGW